MTPHSRDTGPGRTIQTVQGVEVHIEGPEQAPVVLMVHGWPDTLALWDGTVAALQDRFRCVRFSLPGYEGTIAPASSFDAMMALWKAVADAVSPGVPITLLVHDWGCVFGYEFAARHPQRVARVIGVDIGDHNSRALGATLTPKEKAMVLGYQVWLALAWKLSGLSRSLGDGMTRWMARQLRHKGQRNLVGAHMNYPYAMRWFGALGGMPRLAQVDFKVPMLYLYGERKFFMFHSSGWIERLKARPGSAVRAFRTGHWVMLGDPEGFHQAVRNWLLLQPDGA